MRKIPFAGVELTSQRVRGLRGTSQLPERPALAPVDVPLIFFCPADHVPDWQPRVLLGMVEARSVNVKKTTTATTNPLQQNTEGLGAF